MTYSETIQYLFDQLPMYQRLGKAAYKGDLGNTLALDRHFGHPHRKFRIIHVAGTNGKGSVSHMMASVLQSAGYKTGLYTSPHLLDFRERVRIHGQMIPEQYVVDFVEDNRTFIEKIRPSFFEMTVALAFNYFASEGVDVAVVEVGLGGRLDSTNIVSPDLSVITNIGLDHTMFLGDTLDAIAGEKAGIIKSGVPIVIGRYQRNIAEVFLEKAKKEQAPLVFAGDICNLSTSVDKGDFQLVSIECDGVSETFILPLLGNYQQENLITVLVCVKQLRQLGYILSADAVHAGLEKTVLQTGLIGRWQKISDHPVIICDTGHNVDGIKRVALQLEKSNSQQKHVILGMVNDKDVKGILELFPKDAHYYFTRMDISRSMDEKTLEEHGKRVGLKGVTFANVQLALQAAKKNAGDNDLIFIGGSTFIVAEVLGN
jgi:dihydrofolate synthase/folylpolyglutamate synthase